MNNWGKSNIGNKIWIIISSYVNFIFCSFNNSITFRSEQGGGKQFEANMGALDVIHVVKRVGTGARMTEVTLGSTAYQLCDLEQVTKLFCTTSSHL